ncbi:MAG TPA: hypothetical protein VF588_08405 [Pyrinomonadaceae bacterium]|jgi:hypothetical protein
MTRTLKAAALLALLAAALTSAASAERTSRTVESHTFDHKTTSKNKYDLPVHGERVRLRVRATVKEGALKLVVRDAAGRVRQDAQIGPAKSKPNNYDVDSGELRSEPGGVWTVEVELKDAVGSFELTWTTE